MKVLFAVNNEKVAESITRKYQEEYKEIITSKTVYYYNAIIKELQKDKTYDRIVIGEDLEPFASDNYQQIDKYIFEKMDAISDEATNVEGDNIPIILISLDRRTKNDPLLIKLFGLGLYDVLVGQDRSIQKVCNLMYKPRSKKEAKAYYKVEAENVNYEAENSNGVSETEIQNILNHYKKIGNNIPKCVQSFESINSQYSKEQIKLIIEVLPVSVKVILEENSDTYRKIMGIKGKKVAGTSQLREKEYVEKEINTGSKLSKPVIIPTTVSTKNVMKVNKKNNIDQKANEEKMKKEEAKRKEEERIAKEKAAVEAKRKEQERIAKEKAAAEAKRKEEERIAKEKAAAEAKRKEEERIAKEKAAAEAKRKEEKIAKEKAAAEANRKKQEKETKKNEEDVVQPVKRGRGRPRKTPIIVEEEVVPIKRKRGRPRKNVETIEEEENIELVQHDEILKENDDILVNMNNQENKAESIKQAETDILPEFEDYEDDVDLGFDLLDEENELDLSDYEESEEDEIDLLDYEEDNEEELATEYIEENEDDVLPGFDDFEEESEVDDYDFIDEEDEELEDIDYDFIDEEDEELETIDFGDEIDSTEESEEDLLPGFDDYDDEEVEDTDYDFIDEEDEELDTFDFEEEADSTEENEEDVLPGFEDYEDEDDTDYDFIDDEDEELDTFDFEDEDETDFDFVDEEEDSDVLPGFDEDETEETDTLLGFDDEEDEELDTLPGFEEEENDIEEESEIESLEEIEEDVLPGFEDDEPEEITIKQHNGSFSGISNRNYKYDNNLANSIKDLKETESTDNYNIETDNLITGNQKIVSFVGTTKNGTSFIVNNLAELLSNKGIKTAILDLTKNKNSYYIYTNNEEDLRQKAHESFEQLTQGNADGILVNKNLSVFTSLPGDDESLDNVTSIIQTLLENYTVVLMDCDFNTDPRYFKAAQEIYLVQSLDVLTIQPLTAFLRDLKVKGILEPYKLRIVINKNIKVNSLNDRILIGGMSVYNDPGMTYMTELFDKEIIKYTSIPFENQVYVKYLEGLVNCKISTKGYSKNFLTSLNNLSDMVYPILNGKKQKNYNDYSKKNKKFEDAFSKNTSSTLDKMKRNY